MTHRWIKTASVIAGAIFFSTLGIFASDVIRGIDGGLANRASVKGVDGCSVGMVRIETKAGSLCVDQYEASPASSCPHQTLMNTLQTEENVTTDTCVPMSVSDARPWSYVSLAQAQRLCSRANKRLPTPEEWYQFALGTVSSQCVVGAQGAQVTASGSCVSDKGVYDAVGNVWEWVDIQIMDASMNGRSLPGEGYVTSVDADGIALSSGETPDTLYDEDYIWSKTPGVFGMLRGGFYGSGTDAGLYTINASVPTNFATQGVGFRCVMTPV